MTLDHAQLSQETVRRMVETAIEKPHAFEQLYLAHVSGVYRYIFSRTGNRQDAEDLTTQTFLNAMQSLPSLRDKSRFKAWLFSIASNKIRDHYRTIQPTSDLDERLVSSLNDPLQDVMEKEKRTIFTDLVTALTEDERELLRLRFLAELSYAEIGAVVRKSEQAVKKSVYRLLDRLSRRWEEENGQ